MIQKLTVENYRGVKASYRFGEVEPESGFIVTAIHGLGPVKANINMTELSASDGTRYNSGRLEGRNIVIEGQFTYASTIEEARLASYKYFPINKQVTITVETDNRIGEVVGYVESNEPAIFEQLETFQVSIVCESPYFKDVSENGIRETMFAGIEPLFKFPFTNNSITEKLIQFSRIVTKKENTVYYDGDGETGALITIHATGPVGNIDIYNVQTREHMKVDTAKLETATGNGLIAGDTLTINTIRGERSVTLIRGGKKINVLNILGKNPDWFTLAKGDNLFTFVAADGEENLVFTIRAQNLFDGV